MRLKLTGVHYLFILNFILLAPLSHAQTWHQSQKLTAPVREPGDHLGSSVALEGDVAVIGAPDEDENALDNDSIFNSGAAYVVIRDADGIWKTVQKLIPSSRFHQGRFGLCVDIQGTTIVVGGPAKPDNSPEPAGAIYIFMRDSSGQWVEQEILLLDYPFNTNYASSVLIREDMIIAGCVSHPYDENNQDSVNLAGAVYIFTRNSSGIWQQTQKIVAPDRYEGDLFGNDLSQSGDQLALASVRSGPRGQRTGAVYMYKRDGNDQWLFQQKITAPDLEDWAHFGNAVALQGRHLFVGAFKEDQDENGGYRRSNAGATYIFTRDAEGIWNETKKIVPDDRDKFDWFGFSIAIDGTNLLISARDEGANTNGSWLFYGAGACYVYQLDTNLGEVHFKEKIMAADRKSADHFGLAVDISGDVVLVSANLEDDDIAGYDSITSSGSVYFFEYCNAVVNRDTFFCDYFIEPVSGDTIRDSKILERRTTLDGSITDSIIIYRAIAAKIDPTVSILDGKLRSNDNMGDWQWMLCLSGDSLVPLGLGYIDREFRPPGIINSSYYAVSIYRNGCRDTSDCVQVKTLSIPEDVATPQFNCEIFHYYPNPVTNELMIDLDGKSDCISRVINAWGQTVVEEYHNGVRKIAINMDYPAGIYTIEIEYRNGYRNACKFVKAR